MEPAVLVATGIKKSFPGVVALDGVNFALKPGEIHALLGENGAGKSTFVKILTGVYVKEAGSLELDGKTVDFRAPAEALAAGIRVVFQELSQVRNLSVAENIFMGQWPTHRQLVDWRRMHADAAELLGRFKINAKPGDRLGALGLGTRQMIEIVKGCRHSQIKVLILDEPTSALSDHETETLFEFLRGLKGRGISVIYISHRLAEIQRLCDCLTVFRNGRNVGSSRVDSIAVPEIIRMMVGRTLADRFPPKPQVSGDQGLSVKGLVSEKLKSVSFSVRRGEIVGLAGLIGAGKTELLRAIFGADLAAAGSCQLDSRKILIKSPRRAAALGFGYLPESRKEEGLVMVANNRVNISAASLDRLATPFLRLRQEKREAAGLMRRLDVRPGALNNLVANLSGGNQQKVVLARWLMTKAAILLFDEPTRGIDVGARYEIYSLMGELARNQCCILVASSDVEELVGICNRIIVLAKGRIVREFSGSEIDEEAVLHAAAASAQQ
jgi:ribose transport system ATP-binding protein